MSHNRKAQSLNIIAALTVILVIVFMTMLIQMKLSRKTDLKLSGFVPKVSADLYENARNCAVEILVDGHLAGSGWFVDSSGIVMTADHVVGSPGKEIEIMSQKIERTKADVIAVDRGHDLALLKVAPAEPYNPYTALETAKEMPPAGTFAWCYGAPIFRHDVMLTGFVARNDTTFEWFGDQRRYVELMHFSGLTPKGVSGGLWMNEKNKVIGLQSGGMTSGTSQVGVTFVVTQDAILNLTKTRTTAHTPTLSIACEEIWENPAEFRQRFPAKTQGLVVKLIQPDGTAQLAGLKEYDVIISADSTPVRYRDQLLRMVRNKKVGDNIKLTIIKPDTHEETEVEIKLDCLEKEWIYHFEKTKTEE
ncbi:MAG: serine protease [Anaerohalosphaera sp.]|nr:serine protease [Anaerohalosphaera sp.]